MHRQGSLQIFDNHDTDDAKCCSVAGMTMKGTDQRLASTSSANPPASLQGVPTRQKKRLQRIGDNYVEPEENGAQGGHDAGAEAQGLEQNAQEAEGDPGEDDELVAVENGVGHSSEDADLMDYD